MATMSFRIVLDGGGAIGPGKVRLLELIGDHGSIRGAAAELKMSYARAWSLIQELNGIFGAAVVTASAGGKQGGGAEITVLGRKIVTAYRAAETKATAAARRDIDSLDRRPTRVSWRPNGEGRSS
jgi:molybdate transport system regulatory protein